MNALPLIVVTPPGIVIEVNSVQPLKALPPIEVTPGIVTEVKFVQPWKALPPIEVTPGIVTEVKFVQPLKARIPIEVILFGRVIEVRLAQL